MLLAKDASSGALAVSVICVKCGKWHRLYDVWADLRGEAFKDYYCDECAMEFRNVARYINGISVDDISDREDREYPWGAKEETAYFAFSRLARRGMLL